MGGIREGMHNRALMGLVVAAVAASMLLSLAITLPVLNALGVPVGDDVVMTVLGTSMVVTTVVLLSVLAVARDYRHRTSRVSEENRQLAEALSLNQAILDTIGDGVLVVDRDDRPVAFNDRYLELWRVPRALAARARTDPSFRAAEFRAAVLTLMPDPDAYLEKIQQINTDPAAESVDTLFFRDGRRLRRYTAPHRVAGNIVGRVWTFYDISELQHEKERLEAFRSLVEGSHDALLIVDPITSEIVDCNRRAAELHGYERKELLACRLIDINIGIRDTAAWRRAVARMEQEGALIRIVEHIRADGTVFPLEVTARTVDANGRRYVVATERDISERQAMEVELTRERDFSRLLFDLQSTLLAVLSDEGIVSCNAAMARFVGVGTCEKNHQGLEALSARIVERPGYMDRNELATWLQNDAEASDAPAHVLLHSPGAGQVYTFMVQRRRLPPPDTRQLLALTDITELEQRRREIERLAATDLLTGLLNRARFNHVLKQQLEMARRYGLRFSLAMFDVDKFKGINDTHGHLAGDRVLEGIGNVLRSRLRTTDTAARWGGDEFMVLMPKTDAAGARATIESLREAIAQTDFGLDQPVGCSFGITCAQVEDSPETLVARADEAMYRAKRNQVQGKIALDCTAEITSRAVR